MAVSNLERELSYAKARAREDGELDDTPLTWREVAAAVSAAIALLGVAWWMGAI